MLKFNWVCEQEDMHSLNQCVSRRWETHLALLWTKLALKQNTHMSRHMWWKQQGDGVCPIVWLGENDVHFWSLLQKCLKSCWKMLGWNMEVWNVENGWLMSGRKVSLGIIKHYKHIMITVNNKI